MLQTESNKKRLAALQNRKLTQTTQNEVVRNALSDKAVNKITKFSDSDSESEHEQKITDILHDVEENHDFEFTEKPHFFGKKGEKLMTMQTKIGSDDRFQLDERFESDSESCKEASEDEETIELNNERQLLYNAMNSILDNMGINSLKRNPNVESQHVVDQYVRFDPSDASHEKFLIGKDLSGELNNRDDKSKEIEISADDKLDTKAPDSVPIVDKSTFFEVNTDFNKAIAVKSSDSVGFKFDFSIETTGTVNIDDNMENMEAQEHHIKELMQDSSDDEDTIDQKGIVTNNRKDSQRKFFFYCNDPEFKKVSTVDFKRTQTLEEIKEEWIAQRQRLTAEYKKRHKDAIRFQKKFVSKS